MTLSNIQTTWDLARYYYSSLEDPRLAKDIAAILPAIKELRTKYEPILAKFTKSEEILEFYETYEALSARIGKAYMYISYLESLDTQNSAVKKKSGELESLGILMSNELLFINQAWKTIGYEKLIEWSNSETLKAYKNDLISTAESVKRILSEKEEYLLNIKSRPLSVPVSLYEELTNSFEFEIEIDGETKRMTDSEIRSLRESPDREIRKKATESIRKVYLDPKTQITLGNTYCAVVKDWSTIVTLRDYQTVMEPRNITEEMDNEVVDLMMREIQSAYPLFARYLKAKQKILGLDTFYNYDTFAPLSSVETPCTLEE